jgi:hypothetical protein
MAGGKATPFNTEWQAAVGAAQRLVSADFLIDPGRGRGMRRLDDVAPDMLLDVLRPQRPLWINAETYLGFGNAP